MRQLWLRLVPAALGVCAVAPGAEAGPARASFAVSAEVLRRCAIDGSTPAEVRVACSKGTPAPRISRTSPPPAAVVEAPDPRVVESAAPDGATVRVSVDF